MATDVSVAAQATTSRLDDAPSSWTEDRVINVGLAVALVAAVAQIVTQVINFQVYDLRIGALDSDVHGSIFGILSLVAQGATALAAIHRAVRSDHNRRGWLALAALLVALLAARAAFPGDAAPLSAPVLIAFVMFWWLTLDDPPRARTVVLASMAMLAFSFVVHIVGMKIVTALGYGYNTWPYEVKGILKHCTEQSGWILAATGVLAGGFRSVWTPPRRRTAATALRRPGRALRAQR